MTKDEDDDDDEFGGTNATVSRWFRDGSESLQTGEEEEKNDIVDGVLREHVALHALNAPTLTRPWQGYTTGEDKAVGLDL